MFYNYKNKQKQNTTTTTIEHGEITKYLKADKEACAFAVAIAQHERVVLDQIKDCKLTEGKNLFTMWQEDLLDDAWTTFGNVMKFLELDMNDELRLNWLEAEDFPNGQANKKRVESKSNKVSEIRFGDETDTIAKILKPCSDRFNQRVSKRKKENEIGGKIDKNDSDWATVSMSDLVDHSIVGNSR